MKDYGCLAFIRAGLLATLLAASSVAAADRFVVEPGTHVVDPAWTFTNWATAATNIQDAVNLATADETVLVSNGTYVLTNQLELTNDFTITLQSVNGPEVTRINGNYTPGSPTTNNRCLYMTNGSLVAGFTFSNGAVFNASGGGLYVYPGVVSNCIVHDNYVFLNGASGGGGGIYLRNGTITDSRVIANSVRSESAHDAIGGGIRAYGSLTYIQRCVISNNVALRGSGAPSYSGGGVFLETSTILESLIHSNCATYGGGIDSTSEIFVNACTVSMNRATYLSSGATAGLRMRRGKVLNSMIVSNTICQSAAAGLGLMNNPAAAVCLVSNTTVAYNLNGVYMTTLNTTIGLSNILIHCKIENNIGYGVSVNKPAMGLYNCLITGNGGDGLIIGANCMTALVSACTISGNVDTGARLSATAPDILALSSCVIYSNGVDGADDVLDAAAPVNAGALRYSCLGADPGGLTGAGLIFGNPQFVNFADDDFRLHPSSPCINRGSNEVWMLNGVDLDGQPRIRHKIVDMGAYERFLRGSVYSVR